MTKIIQPPIAIPDFIEEFTVFLSGTIDMGNSINWQQKVIDTLKERDINIVILNPRRKDWDASWKQSKDNAEFKGQVDWELDGQYICDLNVMYFAPDSKSPITLLELGLAAESEKLVVCCPEGFYRKGNVDIVCERYGIDQVDNVDAMIEYIVNSYNETQSL